jgi:hypothetical protein
MVGMCHGEKHEIQLGQNVSRSKTSDLASPECVVVKTSPFAWLECVMVPNVRFSMAGMCFAHKPRIKDCLNVSWSKMTDSALLECVGVKNVRSSRSGMCCGQKRQINYG